MKALLATASAALLIAFASPAFAGAGCGKTAGYRPVAKISTPAPVAAAPAATAAKGKDAGKEVSQTPATTTSEQGTSVNFSSAQGGRPSTI
jgi:hypothetical protein